MTTLDQAEHAQMIADLSSLQTFVPLKSVRIRQQGLAIEPQDESLSPSKSEMSLRT